MQLCHIQKQSFIFFSRVFIVTAEETMTVDRNKESGHCMGLTSLALVTFSVLTIIIIQH